MGKYDLLFEEEVETERSPGKYSGLFIKEEDEYPVEFKIVNHIKENKNASRSEIYGVYKDLKASKVEVGDKDQFIKKYRRERELRTATPTERVVLRSTSNRKKKAIKDELED